VFCSSGVLGGNDSGSNNVAVVTGSGSIWGNSTLTIGQHGANDQLIVTNGGRVFCSSGYLGDSASKCVAVVAGTGSVWSNATILYVGMNYGSNQLTIADGGMMYSPSGYVGAQTSSSNNVALVTGAGSVWTNRIDLYVGFRSTGNRLIMTNGGAVVCNFGVLGRYASGQSNVVTVSGNGARWENRIELYVGWAGAASMLEIGSGGSVIASNAYVGYDAGADGNRINVTGGSLIVTNDTSDGALDIRRGTLTFNSGTVTVNRLFAASGASSVVQFNGGVLNTSTTRVDNGTVFVVGNGTDAATLNLLGGGHSFANELRITNNATLAGAGAITAAVTIHSGGVLSPGNSIGTNTVASLTLESGSTLAVEVDGATADQAVVTGTANLGGATLSVSRINNDPTAGAYNIVTATSVSGTFDGLAENAAVAIGSTTYYIHYRSTYVQLNLSPTSVVLLQLQALTQNGQVTVRWSTSSEMNTAGFDLYRLVDGQWVKLNDTLIPAQGWPNGGIGASYSVTDPTAKPGETYTYKLVERTTDGQSIEYGPYERTVSEFAVKNFEMTPQGFKLRWLSRTGEKYRVLKCSDLRSGQYVPIAENLDATPPENEYLDTAASGSGFYRIELQQ